MKYADSKKVENIIVSAGYLVNNNTAPLKMLLLLRKTGQDKIK